MTPAAFLEWLWKIAGGWLMWRPHEFEYANIADIMLAYEGHIEKLKLIHGSGEEKNDAKTTPLDNVDADSFDKVFG